ncbi:MAG: hypothetical protein AAGE01_04005 [Pseudomonadota bacterium]
MSIMRLAGLGLLLSCCNALAIGLGEIEVRSYFGQPLEARIELIRGPGEGDIEITVEEGSALDYRRVGVAASGYSFVFEADAAAIERNDGFIRGRSEETVESLFIDVVVILSAGTTVQIRHYPILLDPPPTSAPSILAPSEPVSVVPPQEPPREPPRAPVAAAPTRPIAVTPPSRATPAQPDATPAGDGRWRVQPGDTLGGIAVAVADGADPDAMAAAILRLNPQAFVDGDPDRLMAGFTLRLPENAAALAAAITLPPAAVPEAEPNILGKPTVAGIAGQEIRRAAEADRVRLRAPPGADEVVSRLGSWIEVDDDELLQRSDAIRRDMAYAKTEITTFQNENENLRERIDLLEQRVGTLRRLIELRQRERTEAVAEAPAPLEPEPAVVSEPAPTGAVAVQGGREAAAAALAADAPPPDVQEPESLRWVWYALLAAVLAVFGVLVWRRIEAARARRDAISAKLAELRSGGALSLPEDL